jgi:hypothetical protein
MNRRLATVAAFAALLLASPALAQISVGGGKSGSEGTPEAKPEPPPAIPGATPNPDAVVPAQKTTGEMSPNDALFDAVHRGDLIAAREALNRGAQVDARNVLGQTPLDVSVDLNRNAITFLLLSMRPAAPPPPAAASAPRSAEARPTKRRGHPAHLAPPPPTLASARQPAAPVASDGGTPKPQAGFLGFGR